MSEIGKGKEDLLGTEHYITYAEALTLCKTVFRVVVHTEYISLFDEVALAVDDMQSRAVKYDGKLIEVCVGVIIVREVMMSVLYKKREGAVPCEIFKGKALHCIPLVAIMLFCVLSFIEKCKKI